MFNFCRSDENDCDPGLIKNMEILKTTETTYNSTQISFYCIGDFYILKKYFKTLKIKDISYNDLDHLLHRIITEDLLILRVFLTHIKSTLTEQEICGSGFNNTYYK